MTGRRKSADELWADTPTLLDHRGQPYRKAGIADDRGQQRRVANPDATRELDRNEVRTPAFAEHPCPPAAQMVWLLERYSGTVPPWRLRASAWVQARYTRELLARSLWPHATVLWDLAPIDPTKGLEFNWPDQVDPRQHGQRVT